MDEQNKLFVFERKEVILIFIFIVLIAVISFTLGVRTGKELSLKADGYTPEDVKSIELKSVTEENVEQVTSGGGTDFETSMDTGESPINQKDIEQKIKDEMKKLAEEDVPVKVDDKKEEVKVEDAPKTTVTSNDPYAGKYTIQLASHKTQDTAQEFADAFIVKGYDVIIKQADIPGRGTWYRVSIGAFDSRQEALQYISGNKDLFQDREYQINQL